MKNIKRIFLLIIAILILPITVYSLEYPKINSKIVEVYDMTDNKVLYEVDSNENSSIASLTKIATVMTAIENIDNIDEKVTITSSILNSVSLEASRAGLRAGSVVTYKDLLYAAMLPSGADATQALAILSSGSVKNFVEKMNKLAEKLELKNTHFVNTTGLDVEGHYSTADDIRKLLVYSLKNSIFKEVYTSRKYTLTNGLLMKSTVYKYNSGVDTSKIIGSKTGVTDRAGYCISALSDINNHDILIVLLKDIRVGNNYYNIIDTVKLIDFLNKNYKDEILVKENEPIINIPVNLSNIDNYQVTATSNVTKFLPSDYDKDKLKIEYDGLKELSYKNKKGDKIGTINYYFEEELINKEDVILDKKIKLDIIKLIKKYYYIIIIIFLLFIFLIKKQKKKKKIKKKS